MLNYLIFIDESGGFSYLDAPENCYVGGWVCKKESKWRYKLERRLRACIREYNKEHEPQLRYPADMHFMPLHTPHKRKNQQDRHIKANPKEAPAFFHAVFKNIEDLTKLVFRSVGLPAIIPHEQAAYMDVLRNTLVQLLNDSIFPNPSSFNIVIASRRHEVLYGFMGYSNTRDYEKYIAKVLKEELIKASNLDRSKIQISFDKAASHPGLMIADFFCGAFKRPDIKYLTQYERKQIIRRYRFSAGFRVLGAPAIQQLEYIQAIDPVAALVQGTQIYAAKRDAELLKDMQLIFDKLDRREKRQLFHSWKNYLEVLLRKSPDRYDNLKEAESALKCIKLLLPSDFQKMDNDTLRMFADLGLQKIRIASHRGKIEDGVVRSHIAFLKDFSQRIFRNRMEYMQHLIDAALIAVQVQAFNPLKFDEAENDIRPIREKYEAMFQPEFSSGNIIDENRAKLEGTYGQICGFLYNLTQEEHYYVQAEKSLQNDIAACVYGEHVWEQGMGFLTSLYWRNGRLSKAIESFLKESQAPNDRNSLFDLSKTSLFGGFEKPFLLLHRLYICALAAEKGEKVRGIEGVGKKMLSLNGLDRYPWFLSAKWLAVLYMKQGKFKGARKLLLRAVRHDKNFTLAFVRLPVKMLLHLCNHHLDIPSDFSLKSEIAYLEELRPGVGKILEQLGIERFYSKPGRWNFYETAVFPPFYYA